MNSMFINTHRLPTRRERTLINRAFDRYGVFEQMKNFALLVSEEQGRPLSICVGTSALVDTSLFLHPLIAGLPIGELTKQFVPSLAGADLFVRLGGTGKHYVTISSEAEALVLYGRDVLGMSVKEASSDLNENEVVILVNQRRETVGIGRTRFSGASLKKPKVATITTISDAGQYLRDENQVRQAGSSWTALKSD